MVIGAFLGYHIYLCTTNQTTFEHLSPFLLLRFLPKSLSVSQHIPAMAVTSTEPAADPRATHPTSTFPETDSPYHFPSPPPTSLRHTTGLGTPARDRPWDEHELSYAQRQVVKAAHGRIRLYDLGWRRNLGQILGVEALLRAASARDVRDVNRRERSPERTRNTGRVKFGSWRVWLEVIAFGGRARGDGKTFPRNPKAKEMLEKLAVDLVAVRERERRGPEERRDVEVFDELELDEI